MADDFRGRYLRVDLSAGRLSDDTRDGAFMRKWVGGSGVGARILYDEVPPGVGWQDPTNRLILASGPLGGSEVAGSGTFAAVGKGPLTNGAFSTHANGYFGAFLRLCGYDGVIVEGAADRVTYLFVHEGGAELRDASGLAGQDTWQMQDSISQELGIGKAHLSVFGIGPAGEHLVKLAGIAGDRGHVAGHNGSGAVMGAKRLKAIAVARGRKRLPIANSAQLARLVGDLAERLKTSPESRNRFKWGTSTGFDNAERQGWLPVKNLTTSVFPEHARFMGTIIREKFEAKRHPCWACPMHHCHMMRVTEGTAAGFVGEEPEYEQWAAFGPVIGNTDPGWALRLANECDRLGMENNEAGWVVAWTMECYEKGLLTQRQLDGLDLRWGNVEAASELLGRIARREGFGALLAEGVMRAALAVGGEAANCGVFTMKGNSPRGHDHRSMWRELLDTCTASTGTVETGIRPFNRELGLPDFPDPRGPADAEEVANLVAKGKGRGIFEDTLGTCNFCTCAELSLLTQLLNAATGWDFDAGEAMKTGLRIANLLRVFNARHGLGAELETPSVRYSSIPCDGPAAGRDVGAVWAAMRERFYELSGWDRKTGLPLAATLASLGLEQEARALYAD